MNYSKCFCKEVKEIINLLWVMLVDGLTDRRTRRARKLLFTLESYACDDMTFEKKTGSETAKWIATPRFGLPGIGYLYSREIYIYYECNKKTASFIKKRLESGTASQKEWAKKYIVCGDCYIDRCDLINSLMHEAVHAEIDNPEKTTLQEEYEAHLAGEQAARALGCSYQKYTIISRKDGMKEVRSRYRGSGLEDDPRHKPILGSWKLPRSRRSYREVWSKRLFKMSYVELRKYWHRKTGLWLPR